MESLTRSLNYELPHDIHFDKYAQHILENSHTPNLADTTTIALASSPSITTLEASAAHQTTTSEFLKKLGATFIHSIQLQSLHKSNPLETSLPSLPAVSSASGSMDMNLEFSPHKLVMDSRSYNTAMDELQKQLDYDKFMNEVWIGVVLTLILISMIFCFCSCFLYHQFRMWKRNYRTTTTPSSEGEAVKFNLDVEDPVPEYTLVSGLPSYEAALELLHKTPQSCLIVHPSVFEVFNKNEKLSNDTTSATENTPTTPGEVSEPLLTEDLKSQLTSNTESLILTIPSTPGLPKNHSLASLLSLTQSKSLPKSKSSASTITSTTPTSDVEKIFKS
ncbi:hypothetical protein DOY81_008555 [Sarcophaga bullata]|nr:hypothetical protein DOY81_008555 [Sarcophaga bullata]